MPRALPLSRRISTAARWPAGVGLTSWRYMWRTTPLHRTERHAEPDDSSPPELPTDVASEEIQTIDAGAGPLFHRLYRTRIRDASCSAEELMQQIGSDPNAVAPTEFARFFKVVGEPHRLRAGDEFTVRMPGPWDGPVRVVDVTPSSFRLATLEGHLEAGQIEFRAYEDSELVFEIESWARSGDRLSSLLFDRLRIAKEVQLHMWISVLERATKLAGGTRAGLNSIETLRFDMDD
ncbi:MAG: hypothetical protein QOH48_2279 [Actinomycetota bacterium]|jgi:hypothetical protein|nr:hypothetical protein [Actinomycetota bacterium]